MAEDDATHPIRWVSRGFLAFRPAPHPRWPIAVQAALAMALPVAVFVLRGETALGLVSASGAFAILYGASWTVAERARILPLVAVALLGAAALGTLVAPVPVLAVLGLVAVSLVAAWWVYGFSLGAPGPIFFALVYGLSAHVTAPVLGGRAVEPGAFLGALGVGIVIAYAVAVAPLVLPSVRRAPSRPLAEVLPRRGGSEVRTMMARVALVAGVGAVVAALWVDPVRAYWVVCSGLAVIGVAAGRRHAVIRGVQRTIGSALGAGLFALFGLLQLPIVLLPVLLGLLQFTIEMLVVRNYALALVFITPLVLIITTAATSGDASAVVGARVLDTAVGAALAILSGFLHPPHERTAAP